MYRENCPDPFTFLNSSYGASLVAQLVKNLPAIQETQFHSWVRKIPWRRDRLFTLACLGFPYVSAGKESACNVGDLGLIPGKIPWRRERLPTPVGREFHGLYSPCGCKKSDTTEQISHSSSNFHMI